MEDVAGPLIGLDGMDIAVFPIRSTASCERSTGGVIPSVRFVPVVVVIGGAVVMVGASRNGVALDENPGCGSADVPKRMFLKTRILRMPACRFTGMRIRTQPGWMVSGEIGA